MSNDEGPLPLIVSSPSGAGKTTLTGNLRRTIPELHFSVSHTTRKMRAGEQDGREYYFVSRAEFEARVRDGLFLEWAEVHGNLYGTGQGEFERARGERGIIFDIDHQGARQILAKLPNAVSVFILPPSMPLLHERLRGRASEDDATVARRFGVAKTEIAHYGMFDYLLVNENLEEATQCLVSIFLAEECRRRRKAHLAEALLREGQSLA